MSFAQSEDAKLAANLRTKDELLLNAVHRGNRRAWAEATTDDFLYIEDGEILHREAFLKELEEDGSSPLIIHTFEVHRIGDTAMVLHLDDVPQRPMRDRRNSHLLFSETWQRTGGESPRAEIAADCRCCGPRSPGRAPRRTGWPTPTVLSGRRVRQSTTGARGSRDLSFIILTSS